MKQINAPAFLPDDVCARLRIFEDRDSWLENRSARIAAGGIGSTTAGALLGLSPWKTTWEVWAQVHAPHLLSSRKSDAASERRMARGLALEGLADKLYSERMRAETFGVNEHMSISDSGGVLVSSPDAFASCMDDVGVAEYKVIQPWNRDHWPDRDMEVRTLADFDAASSSGRWPVSQQYVIQAYVHLLATGLDFCDLFAIFAKDVELGYRAEGWDTPIAVEGTCCLRIWRDEDTLAAVRRTILSAHKQIIIEGIEPSDSKPPAPWDLSRDPLTGKREATAPECDVLAEIAQLTAKGKATKSRLDHLRADLRDSIADSGVKAIAAESTAGKISASIAKSGRFTIRGL